MPTTPHQVLRSRGLLSVIPLTAIAILASMLGVTAPVPAGAATTDLTVTASADTYLNSARPNKRYGSRARLRTDGRPAQAILVRFRVPGTPAPITRATLQVFSTSSSAAGLTASTTATRWKEKRVTWRKGPVAGGIVASVPQVSAGTWVSLDVTSAVASGSKLSLRLATPGTRRVRIMSRESGPASAPRLVLETAGPGTGTPVVAAAGDIACDPAANLFNGGNGKYSACKQRATSDLMLATPNLAAVLPLGDLQYEVPSLKKFQASYDLSWGRLKAITRPAAGNHEYEIANAAGYFAYFGAAAGDPKKGYYSYDLGTWHVVALNSNCFQVGGCGEGSAQLAWLRADLAAHPTRCTLAYWHHPAFSSGNHGNTNAVIPLWDALDGAGAEVVLSGHDHIYERFDPQNSAGGADPNGMTQFVVGTGGRNHDGIGTVRANSRVRNSTTFGVLALTLRPDGYDWQFLPEPGLAFADSGSAACL